ncbi:hypothetical protein IP69_01735 [Bosea sp. AAP35]|uniref:hypothetical protein n=1 Tax=Bosea sp. AAP35 TaxID=1523417 RepID=UPI0006B8EE4B|nr:hypothetical protein [Bosea sp. AAP35]KPF72635.1 hypothetical protein IP69_01735 [Bosea sp. AAP35]
MDLTRMMQDRDGMVRIIAALLAAFILLPAPEALAASACRPTRDGKDRIEPVGGCPSGYTMRGACCESLRTMSQPSTVVKTCPAGMVSALGTCVARK